jgi:surfactin synthase thioesterase subunit
LFALLKKQDEKTSQQTITRWQRMTKHALNHV